MRYWYFDESAKRATGPHLDVVLARQKGFGPESRVALEGARSAKDWRLAKDVPELAPLLAALAAPPAGAGGKDGKKPDAKPPEK